MDFIQRHFRQGYHGQLVYSTFTRLWNHIFTPSRDIFLSCSMDVYYFAYKTREEKEVRDESSLRKWDLEAALFWFTCCAQLRPLVVENHLLFLQALYVTMQDKFAFP